MSKKKQELTLEQKRKILLTPCKTKKEVQSWIRYFLNIDLPDVTVSQHANINPLDAVWEIYSICTLKQNPSNIQELLYTASRGSGKTLATAIAEFMILLHDQRDMAHIGAIMAQAKRAYEYIQGFCLAPNVKPIISPAGVSEGEKILQKSTMEKSIFNIDGKICTMEILPTTMKALNGLHCIGGKTEILIDNSNGIFKSRRIKYAIHAKKLHDLIKSGVSVNVFSYNHVTEQIESKPITGAYENGKQSRLKIEKETSLPLWCTEDHKIYDPVSKTYKKAIDFKVGDEVLTTKKTQGNVDCSKENCVVKNSIVKIPDYSVDDLVEQVMLGSLLGDGGVYKRYKGSKVAVYAENHGASQKDYALWKKDVLSKRYDFLTDRDSVSGFNKDRIGIRISTRTSSDLMKYINFKKDFDDALLKKIDILALAVWYMDDGHKDHFCTHGFSADNLLKLSTHIKNRFDINLIIKDIKESNGKTYNILKFKTQKDYAKFYALTYTSLHPTMKYKLDNFKGHYVCSKCGIDEFRVNTNNNSVLCLDCINKNKRNWQLDRIVNITHIPQKRAVYDFTVQDNHNFIAGGMLVHNCSLVSTDELDTLSGEGLRAIKEVAGMLDTKKGKKPLRVGISTRKSKHGLMNKMIEGAAKEGRHLRFWTALEFTEKCPDSRSGVIPTDYWINVEKGEVLSQAEYNVKDISKQKDYLLEQRMLDKCKSCPVAVFCRGDAKKQISKSNMLKSIDELNQKIISEGYDWASSQLFNLKPSTEGVVYKEFEEKLHTKSWNEMWKILVGKDFPGECTHDIFVKKCHEMKLPCYGGIDWGWSSPNTIVYFFADRRDNIFVVKADGMTYISQPAWIHHVKTKYHNMYRCQMYFADPADQGALEEMRKAGLAVANQIDKSINTGIQVIKKFLRTPGSTEPKLFLAKETTMPLQQEFSLYHFKLNAAGEVTDDPDTEYDHYLDALRYIMIMLYGKSTIVLGGNLEYQDADVADQQGSYLRTPSPEEFAKQNGLNLNTEVDTSKLGQIGKKSELDSDDDGNDGIGGNGGFLWSF